MWCEGISIGSGEFDARFCLRTGELEFTNLKDGGRWGLKGLYMHDHPEVEAVLSVENPYYSEEFSLRCRIKDSNAS